MSAEMAQRKPKHNPEAYKIEDLVADYDMPAWKVRRMNISLNHMNSDHSATVILQN